MSLDARAPIFLPCAQGVEPLLAAARDAGRANLAAIAAAEAAPHGLTVPQCLGYLRDNLHYDLGPREREAIARFRSLSGALGLLDPVHDGGRRELPIPSA